MYTVLCIDHLTCLKQLTQRADYVPNQVTVHGATPTYFAAQEGRFVRLRISWIYSQCVMTLHCMHATYTFLTGYS